MVAGIDPDGAVRTRIVVEPFDGLGDVGIENAVMDFRNRFGDRDSGPRNPSQEREKDASARDLFLIVNLDGAGNDFRLKFLDLGMRRPVEMAVKPECQNHIACPP